jgi:hypothetical protein
VPEAGDQPVQPDRAQRVDAVDGEREERAHADRVALVRLEHRRLDAGALERHRRDRAGDAAPDDQSHSHGLTIHNLTIGGKAVT